MKEPFPVWCGISAFSLTLIGWGRRTRVYFASNFITFDPQSITVLLVAGLSRHYSCTIELTFWWCASHWILIHSQNHVVITALWFKNIFLYYPLKKSSSLSLTSPALSPLTWQQFCSQSPRIGYSGHFTSKEPCSILCDWLLCLACLLGSSLL